MFIKKTNFVFAIVAIYVDDMNLIGTPEEVQETTIPLKSEFKMKDLGRTNFCLGLEL
jgi:hypothetical protein